MSATLEADLRHPAMEPVWRLPLLDAGEERRLLRAARAGDLAARDELIRRNLRLVASIARPASRGGVPFADLFQEGVVGLLRAFDRFDDARGTRFSSYATFWIRQAIHDAARSNTLIRVPRHAAAEQAPAAELVADAARLDAATQHDRTSEPVAEQVQWELRCRELRNALRRLSRRERVILTLRYGLNGRERRTLEDAARLVGLSRESVRQIEIKALERLAADREVAA